jgi:hypothetical protein
MDITIGLPTFKSTEKSYLFPITTNLSVESDSQYLEAPNFPDPPDLETSEFKSLMETLVEGFIEKSKRHFSTPLRTKTILSRLNHVWEGNGKGVETPGWYAVTWTPKELKIMPREFVLIWKNGELRTTEPVIPSEFVMGGDSRSASPAPELRTIQLQQTTSSTNGLVELEPSFSDPSDSRLMTLEYEAPSHRLEKKKIREAKLRAALASLKAERLTEKYYEKYGTIPGEDSSDLSSSDSEVEDS